jgi:hypothetical protein
VAGTSGLIHRSCNGSVEHGVVQLEGAMWVRRGFGGKEEQSEFCSACQLDSVDACYGFSY